MVTRLLGLAYSSVLCGVAVNRLIDSPGARVPVALITFVVVIAYRMWRFGVLADDEWLVVRNTVLTRRVARSRIKEFRLDDLRFTLPDRQVIRAALRDGRTLTLGVTTGFKGRPAREPDLAALRSWLRDGRAA